MADNGNGQLNLDIRNRVLGISGPHVVSILLILAIGAFGYFLGTQVTTNQQQGLQSLAALVQQLSTHQAALVELVHTNRQQMEDVSRAQNTLLHQQTTLLTTKVDEQSAALNARFEKVDAKFDKVYAELAVLNYNIHKDLTEQLPLDVPLVPPR